MGKWMPLLLAAMLLLSACGQAETDQNTPPPGQDPPPQTDAGADTGTDAGAEEETGFRMTQESSVRNEKFREREEFAGFIGRAESQFLIPGLNQAMTPQGISYSEETGLVYITSYAIADTPSVISGLSLETGEQAVEYYLYNSDGTPFTSHVGGIAVTKGYIFVSAKLDSDGSYSIAALPLPELPQSGSHDVTVEDTIPLPVSPSFLNCSQGKLWAGNFYHPKGDYNLSKGMDFTTPTADGESGCYILGYDLDENGGLSVPSDGERYPVPSCALVAPDKIQGAVVLPESGGGYRVWLSQSYGRTANSALLAYSIPALGDTPDTQVDVDGHSVPAYILDSGRLQESLEVMPMTEGLSLSPDGVLVLFESGSSRYSDGKYRTDHVWQMTGE